MHGFGLATGPWTASRRFTNTSARTSLDRRDTLFNEKLEESTPREASLRLRDKSLEVMHFNAGLLYSPALLNSQSIFWSMSGMQRRATPGAAKFLFAPSRELPQ